jgi:AAA domain-containing protein
MLVRVRNHAAHGSRASPHAREAKGHYAMKNDDLDAQVIALDRCWELKNKYGIIFTKFADIDQTAQKDYLIQKFLGAGEMSCWYGAPGCGKSVLLTDAGPHVAWGQPWFGRRTSPVGVLYVAAERTALVKRRLAAFRLYHDVDNLPLAVISGSIDLRSNHKGAAGIIDCAKRWQDEEGIETRLIIGDTYSRLLAGGDENSPKDVGAFINNIARIQDAIGAHVSLVHHVPHEQNRMRGHGALLAACDTTIHVEKHGHIRTATIVKNNDGEEGERVSFTLESVAINQDADGNVTTAPVVIPADVPSIKSSGNRWTKGLRLVQESIVAALNENSAIEHRVANNGPQVRAVFVDDARPFHRHCYVHGGEGDRAEAERKAWQRNLREARNRSLIGSDAISGREIVWLL